MARLAHTRAVKSCRRREGEAVVSPSAEHVEGEVVGGARCVSRVYVHRACRLAVGARATRDRERAVAGIEEWPLDGDLAVPQRGRERALPRNAGHGAHALAAVATDRRGVRGVVDRVTERQRVADRVADRAVVDDRVAGGPLDDAERGAVVRGRRERTRNRNDCEHRERREDACKQHLSHSGPPGGRGWVCESSPRTAGSQACRKAPLSTATTAAWYLR